jgi:hypothetical protein
MKHTLHSLLRKCSYVTVILLAFHSPTFSQAYSDGTHYEGGIMVAPMVFLGDLGGHTGRGTTFLKDYNMSTTKLAVGAFLTMHPSEWLNFRLSVTIGGLEGNDNLIKPKGGDETSRYDRNLDFRSPLDEAYVAAEIYPTVFLENDDPTDVTGRLRPYGLIGVGVFHFNPQGTYTDPGTGVTSWVDLRPLHTEGEGFAEYPGRKEYALTQINIPMGVGVKYYFSQNVNLSFEIIHRKTFTDYIDDVSTTYIDPSLFSKYLSPAQAVIATAMYNKSPLRNTPGSGYQVGNKRGDPTQNDAYFTAGFKLSIRLNSGNEWNNSTRCPLLRF